MSDVVRTDAPENMPALFRSVEECSRAGQDSFLLWVRVRFIALVVAALGGAMTWTEGHAHLGALLALVMFAAALLAEGVLAIRRPDRLWYQGRAAAESVKTLAWRYMMRAESYEEDVQNVDARFIDEIFEVLNDLGDLPLPPARGDEPQITSRMREVRDLSFADRRQLFLEDRIRAEQNWYADEGNDNEDAAGRWVKISVGLEAVGLIAAILKATGKIDFDLLGICAAAAGSAGAWMQAKQYQNLATAYGIASHELASVASEVVSLDDETQWPQFVAEAEEAISREHTLWRASRGIRIRRPRH